MEQKIQELTAKIFQDGVQKGEVQARALIAEAQSKAAATLSEAKAQAAAIVAEAQKQAAEIKRNAEAEIRQSGAQAISSIKQQIVELVCAKVIDSSSSKVLSDPETIKEFIVLLLQKWSSSDDAIRLDALLPEQRQQELTDAFKKGASDILGKELTISFSKAIKGGFRIGPQNGTYKISLSDEDFAEFFKEFLRPKTRSWLFGE